ncbi:MAG: response regulator [Ktedonobacterales bacterium]
MASAATERGSWSILVVDDEENLNWSLVNSLRKEGYTADGALTGEDAQRRMTSTRYDCVISDVKMPGMDGFELLQWLRQHRPRTRVIMMTAFGSPTARQEAMRSGVIAYLEKPFDLATLKEELRRLVPAEGSAATEQAESEAYDLVEVSRVLNLTRRDVAIGVQAGGIQGTLRFLRGELVWAQAGTLQGDDAFLALCASRGAALQPETWDGRSERNVTQSLSQLIYSALARRQGTSAPLVPSVASRVAQASSPSQPNPPALSAAAPEPLAAVPPSSPLPPRPTAGPLTSAGGPAAEAAVHTIAAALPQPSGVALLRPEGGILAQAWSGRPEVPPGMFSHLASAAQAGARALLLADLGIMDDMRIAVAEYVVLVRRVAHGEHASLIALVLPAGADLAAITALIQTHTPELIDALR